MIVLAQDVGHPRVLLTLKRAEHTLKRQLSGVRTMGTAVAGVARTTRLLEEQHVLAARKGLAAARLARAEAQAAAASAEARLRASRTFQLEWRRLRKKRAESAALAAPRQVPPQALDAVDLGQGRKHSGGHLFQRARQNLWQRVVRLFPDLPEVVRVDVGRTYRLWDVAESRRLGIAWGHVYRNELLKLKRVAEGGDRDALLRCVRVQRRFIPAAEITV